MDSDYDIFYEDKIDGKTVTDSDSQTTQIYRAQISCALEFRLVKTEMS